MVSILKIYLSETMRWLYWYPLRRAVQIMPLRFSYGAARLAGSLLALFARKKKEKLRRGFNYLFGNHDHGAQIKRTFGNYTLNSIEVFLYPDLTEQKVASMVEYSGLEKIARALEKGKGAILLHGHFGNEEFLMPAVAFATDVKVNQLASRREPRLKDSLLYRFPNAIRRYAFRMRIGYRESLPVNFIYIDKGIKGAYRALQNNEILLLAGDGREGAAWTEANFLGRTALYSEGPMRIALATGAEVLPVFLVRRPDHRHSLIVEEPLPVERTGDSDRDIQVNTRKFVDLLSAYAAQYPCHYMKLFWHDMKYFKEFSV